MKQSKKLYHLLCLLYSDQEQYLRWKAEQSGKSMNTLVRESIHDSLKGDREYYFQVRVKGMAGEAK